MEIKDIENIPTTISKVSAHGFTYYFCCVIIVIIAAAWAFLLISPSGWDWISNHGVWGSLGGLLSILTIFFAGDIINKIKKSESEKNSTNEILVKGFKDLGEKLNKSIDKINGINDNFGNLENSLVRKISNVFEEKKQRSIQEHDMLFNYRLEHADGQIRSILKDLLIDLHATKVCVFEMHNGTNNVTGVPFLHADMTYEETADDKYITAEEFKNFNLSRYTFISSHIKEGNWCGSIDDVKKEDPKLAAKLYIIDVKYAAMMVLHGQRRPIGFLQIYFTSEEHPANKEILSIANVSAQKIAALIDKDLIDQK